MTLSIQGSDGFVASTAAWIATGRKTTKLTGWDFHPLKNHTFSRRTPRLEGFAKSRVQQPERTYVWRARSVSDWSFRACETPVAYVPGSPV